MYPGLRGEKMKRSFGLPKGCGSFRCREVERETNIRQTRPVHLHSDSDKSILTLAAACEGSLRVE